MLCTHLLEVLMSPQMLGFPLCLTLAYSESILAPPRVLVCLLLRRVAMVAVGCMVRTGSPNHTMLSGHQDVLVGSCFQERVFSLLSGAEYPVSFDAFVLDIRP